MNNQEKSIREKLNLLTDFLLTKEIKEESKYDQYEILIEEMAKLTTAITHYKRNKCGKEKVIEELSHVLISSECLRKKLDISHYDIENEIQKKLDKYKVYQYYYDKVIYKSENLSILKNDECYIIIPNFIFDKNKIDRSLRGRPFFYKIYNDFIVINNFDKDTVNLLDVLKSLFPKI